MKKESFIDIAYCKNCLFRKDTYCHLNHKEITLGQTCSQFTENTKKEIKKVLKIDYYMDNVGEFHQTQPFFYDKTNNFWFWGNEESKWGIVDNIDLMNKLDDELGFFGQTVTGGIKRNYIEAFKRVGRKKKPKDSKKHLIQFKDKLYNIKTNETIKADSSYFVCNPIPYGVGKTSETPIIDKLFEDWVGSKDKQTLYEIIAYCCLTDYPIHLIFCFIGSGRNGKTKFQQLLTKFIGKENTCSTELDTLLDSRFESVKLFKKLVCTLGETNFGVMSKTSLLKKLSGQDLIGFEFKNKLPFDDYNYAKILINSNSLPSSEDTSEGFYRRWLIVDFPNQFPEGKNILDTIPEEEFNNLAKKVTEILPDLIKRGNFTHQGTIKERQERYVMASNPLPYFIENYCERKFDNWVRYSEFYNNYCKFLNHTKRRIVSRKEFKSALLREGLESRKTHKAIFGTNGENGYFIEGVSFIKELDFLTNLTNLTIVSVSSHTRETSSNNGQICQICQITQKDILEYIKANNLVEIQSLINSSEKREDWVIEQIKKLKNEGLIFEVKPGFVKAL